MAIATKQDFEVGTTVQIETVLAVEAVVVDGDNVSLTVKPPQGANFQANVVRNSLGHYSADVIATRSGQWYFRWACNDPITVDEGSFVVRKSLVI